MAELIYSILGAIGTYIIFKTFLKWSDKHDQGYGIDDQYGNLF